MKQSKLESLVEAIVNTVVGFFVTMSAYPLINWICGIEMSLSQASLSMLLFTVLSVIRGYVIRRFFNNMIAFKHWVTTQLKYIL
jgi:predicted Na+-dependent transporter